MTEKARLIAARDMKAEEQVSSTLLSPAEMKALDAAFASGEWAKIGPALRAPVKRIGVQRFSEMSGVNVSTLRAVLDANGNPTVKVAWPLFEALQIHLTPVRRAS